MIKAIETEYHGHKFRSRLEARWAVFFDNVGAQWEYEKEGFDLGEVGQYLPDFWMPYATEWLPPEYPNAGHWIEIKGITPTDDELTKVRELAISTLHSVRLICGPPDSCEIYYAHRSGNAGWQKDDTMRLHSLVMQHTSFNPASLIDTAVTMAMQARFEYGETPTPPTREDLTERCIAAYAGQATKWFELADAALGMFEVAKSRRYSAEATRCLDAIMELRSREN